MPSTPSSTDREPRRFTRGRLITLLVISVVIPLAVLGVILTRDDHHEPSIANGIAYDASKAKVGELAPDFAARDLHGNVVRLSQFRGRSVVLTFFASWCHPCEEELPVLEKLQHDSGPRVAVLAVSYNDLAPDSRAFAKRLGVTFPVLLESAENTIAKHYGVHEIPITFFINARGVVATAPLYGSGSRKALQPGIDKLLG
ncbi:MAG TPA: TlpA disulfide reductase family protein [Acidimicrobiia bacterium]|nr:TlpA disulfide reductase family protein [Acidimicrobiia bacterium]